MKIFRFWMALVTYFDFFYTSLFIGNYRLYVGEDKNWLNNKTVYLWIISFQILEIVLNFFKIIIKDTNTI